MIRLNKEDKSIVLQKYELKILCSNRFEQNF